MAEPVTVARPYAEAIFKLAREKNELARFSDMLALITTVVEDPRVAKAIGNPTIPSAALESLILGTLGERLDGRGRNLVQVLIANRRLELVPHIRVLYEALRREHEGILEARIISAFPMGNAQLAELVARLEAKYHRKVSAQVEVDRQLIGGVRIIIGDKVLDATVRGQLDAMASALTH